MIGQSNLVWHMSIIYTNYNRFDQDMIPSRRQTDGAHACIVVVILLFENLQMLFKFVYFTLIV